MKKKASTFLPEKTSEIVIAVICVVFLVFLLGSLYYAKIQKDDLKKAGITLDKIEAAISAGGGRADALTPEGWHVFSFLGDKRPNSCAGKNCLCICDKISPANFWSTQEEECNEGACLIVENLKFFPEIEIKDVADSITNIEIKKEGELFVVNEIR